ncbi:MAG: MAPEG family protein [Cocleimonas sp.]
MTQKAVMLLPMVILVFVTFGMMLWMLKLRYKAVLKDGFDPKFFRLYDNSQSSVPMPEYLVKVTQHYQNLLEMPPLFYLALILLAALNITDTFYVILSWGFLFSRLFHSYIHTTGNRVLKRKNAFIVSLAILITLWARIAIELISL